MPDYSDSRKSLLQDEEIITWFKDVYPDMTYVTLLDVKNKDKELFKAIQAVARHRNMSVAHYLRYLGIKKNVKSHNTNRTNESIEVKS